MIQPTEDIGFIPETEAPKAPPAMLARNKPEPAADIGFTPDAVSAPTQKIDWDKKFSEVDTLMPEIPKGDKIRAINESWLHDRNPDSTPEEISRNYDAYKSAYAGVAMGKDYDKQFGDEEFSGFIKKKMSQERDIEKVFRNTFTKETLGESWANLNIRNMPSLPDQAHEVFTKMSEKSLFDWVPSATDAPDIRWMGPANPAVLAAVHNEAILPMMKGVTTPLGLALMPVQAGKALTEPGFNFTKGIMGGIAGGFSVLMAKENAEYLPEFRKVFDNPESTFQQRTEAVTKLVFNNLLGVAAAFGAVSELYPGAEELSAKVKGKNPKEAAAIIREEANNTTDVAASDALIKASEELDNPKSPPTQEEINKEFQRLVPAPEPELFSADTKLADLIGKPIEYSGYDGTLIRDSEGNFVLLRDVVKAGEPSMIEIADTGKIPDILATEVGVAPKGGFEKQVPVEQIKAAAIITEDGTVVEGLPGQSHDDIGVKGERIFTTTLDRQVNRDEGMVVAKKAGQVPESEKATELHSHMVKEAKAMEPAPEAPTMPAEKSRMNAEREGFGISNDSIDSQLEQMGLPAATHGEKKAWEEARSKAMETLREDPQSGQKLVDELSKKSRPATANENALLTAEVIRLRNERADLEATLETAKKIGDAGVVSDIEVKISKAQDEFERTSDVVTKAGTANAQALAIRAMMLKEDYSMASMEIRAKEANKGVALNPEQAAQVKAQYEKILATETRLNAKMTEMMNEFKRSKETRGAARPPREPSRTTTYLTEKANLARERLKQKSGRVAAGVDPTDLSDYAIIAAEHISKGIDAAAELIKEYGERIRPYMDKILEDARLKEKTEKLSEGLKVPINLDASLGLKILNDVVKPEGLDKRPKVIEIAQWFQDKFGEPIDYKTATETQKARLTDSIVQETKAAFKLHPEAAGWYNANVKLMLDVMREIDPDLAKPENDFIFKALLAMTSDGNIVESQFKQSWKTYQTWKETGNLVGDHVSGKTTANIRANIEMLAGIIKKKGMIETRDWMFRKGALRDIRKAAIDDFGFSKEEAGKIGTGEAVDSVVPYAVIFGPKLGSFFNNLYGDFSTVTMDRWFMRTMGRLTGTQVEKIPVDKLTEYKNRLRESFKNISKDLAEKIGLKKSDFTEANIDSATGKIATYFQEKAARKSLDTAGDEFRKAANAYSKSLEPLVESPENSGHRTWIRGIIENTQSRLKAEGISLENADLQALLWYGEKELYEKLGYRSRSSAADYAAAAESVYVGERGRPSRSYAAGTGRVGSIGRGAVDTERPGALVETALSKVVKDARARIESRMKEGRLLSGLDPSEIVDYAIVGADYLGRGVRDFTKWSAEMVKEFGESVKPMLRDIYSKAQVEQKNAVRLQAYKTRTEKQTADLLERARTGNLAPKPKPGPFKFDEEALRLQAENIEAKREFEKALLVKKLEERTSLEYARDQFLKYRRGFLLSNPVTLAKLSAAAAARIAITPIEEAVGGALGKIPGISAVAKKAAREGDFNIQAEAKAVASLFEKGLPDAWETMTKGKGPIDSVFGRKGIHESEINPSAVEFFGQLHAALKAPVKRAEFVRATEKISQFYAKEGMDIKDPMMMERIGIEAYKSAERSIFMNDNAFATAFNNTIRSLETPSKATGKPTLAGKAASTVLQTLFPIVKVPTSIVLETAEYAGGTVKGLYDLRKAYEKGIDNLTSDQADVIMRQLKKGSIGGALLVFGYFNPQIFGGYYELGEKRKSDEPKAKSMKVDGREVPAYLLHAPVHEIPQMGATARRAVEEHLKKGESEEIAIASGAWAAGIGLIEEIPFTRGAIEVSRLVDPMRREAAAGNILKSIIVPQLFQYAAEKMDVDVYGEPIKRKPKTMMQAIESGIPGLREDVPVKRDINTSYRK